MQGASTPLLDPGPQERRRAREAVLRWSDRHLLELNDRKPYARRDITGAGILKLPIQEEGRGDIEELMGLNFEAKGLRGQANFFSH